MNEIMGWFINLSERGGEVRRFEEGLKMAKAGLMEACEIWEDMKGQFSERNGYGERSSYGERYNPRAYSERAPYPQMGGYPPMPGFYGREGGDMAERRMRDSMGRYM